MPALSTPAPSRSHVTLDVNGVVRAVMSHTAWTQFVDAMMAAGRLNGGRATSSQLCRTSQHVESSLLASSASKHNKDNTLSSGSTKRGAGGGGGDASVVHSAARRFLRSGDDDALLQDEVLLALSTEQTGVPVCRRMMQDLFEDNVVTDGARRLGEQVAAAEGATLHSSIVANPELDRWWSRMIAGSDHDVSEAQHRSMFASHHTGAEWSHEDIVTEYMGLAVRGLKVLSNANMSSSLRSGSGARLLTVDLINCCPTFLLKSDVLPSTRSSAGTLPTRHVNNEWGVALQSAMSQSHATLATFNLSFPSPLLSSSRGMDGAGDGVASISSSTSSMVAWLCGAFTPLAAPPAALSGTTMVQFSALRRFSLTDVPLGDRSAAVLLRRVLPRTPNLARLELVNIGCGEQGAAALGELFAAAAEGDGSEATRSAQRLCMSLRVLEVPRNPLGRQGLIKILNGLVLGCRSLQHLGTASAGGGSPRRRTPSSPTRWMHPSVAVSPRGQTLSPTRGGGGASTASAAGASSSTRPKLTVQPQTSAAMTRRRDPVVAVSVMPPPTLYLRSLDVSETSIGQNAPAELFVLLRHFASSSLRSLRLSGNDLGLCGAKLIGEHLGSASSTASGLELLDLSGNLLADGGVVAVAKAVQAMSSSLRVLNLADNRIETIGGVALAAVLQRGMPQLEVLCLEGNHKLGDVAWAALGQALSSGLLSRLGELDLAASGLQMTRSPTTSTVAAAESTMSTFQDANTTTTPPRNFMSPVASNATTTSLPLAVAQGLRAIAAQIGRLDVSHASLADRAAVSLLATAIRRMRSLTVLSMKQCGLQDEHLKALVETGLVHIAGNLQVGLLACRVPDDDNDDAPLPSSSPAALLVQRGTCRWMGAHLRVLSLRNNPIGDAGMLALCSSSGCLESCVHLVLLDVAHVGFEEAGLNALCGLLRRWTDRAASLSSSSISSSSSSSIVDGSGVSRASHPLEALDVSGNVSHISQDAALVALFTALLYTGGGTSNDNDVEASSPFSSLTFLNATISAASPVVSSTGAPVSSTSSSFSGVRPSKAVELHRTYCYARRFVHHHCLPLL